MLGPGQVELGSVLYEHDHRYICEGGICDNKKSILWNEVDALFIRDHETAVNSVPVSEFMTLKVTSTTGTKINLKLFSRFFHAVISRRMKDEYLKVYQLIVSKIIDRQLSKLLDELREGKRVSFKTFDITSTAIYRKRLTSPALSFGGREKIELSRIVGCDFEAGEFIIKSIDGKGRSHSKRCGYVYKIPNIHLAQTFLSLTAQHTLQAMKNST